MAEIMVDKRRASGVRLADGAVHRADHIISNADVAWTYLNLIPGRARGLRNSDLRYRKLTHYSMSLVVIYFGTKKLYRHEGKLAHHNIILSERYQGLLADIFKHKTLPEDFSLYLHMPTLTDPSIAPPGHEGFYVLSPVPHLGGNMNWAQAARPYRDAIMRFLEENYLPDSQANKEALRLYPPIHVGNRFAAEDTEITGYELQAGTRVMASIYLTHRDPRYWDEPEQFRPERFGPKTKRPSAFTYIPFGGGPRACIGASFAQVETKVVLGRIL